MALVNIVRSGGGDTHDLSLYLNHIAANRSGTVPTGDASDGSRIPASSVGDIDIGDITAAELQRGVEARAEEGTPGEHYCVECEDAEDAEESQRIVPVQDVTGALPFNQKGTSPPHTRTYTRKH